VWVENGLLSVVLVFDGCVLFVYDVYVDDLFFVFVLLWLDFVDMVYVFVGIFCDV